MKKPKKTTVDILITQPISSARILRTIAANKGFGDNGRKKFIEYLCENEVQKFINKQQKMDI